MKKLLIALVLVLAFAIPVLANPFVDVPLNHWAYDAVQTLAAKGVIIGYPDGTFGGNRAMTRYEFAEAVARGLGYMEKYVDEKGFATKDDVALLEKLVQEFADELKNLGVTVEDLKKALGENSQAIKALEDRVALLEKYAAPIKFTGDFDILYDAYFPTATGKTNIIFNDTTNLYMAATINDYTTAGVTLTIDNTIDPNASPTVKADNFWLIYQKDPWYIQVGQIQQSKVGLGLVLGDYQPEDDYDDDPEYDLNYEGFYAAYTPAESDIAWKTWGAVNKFYTVKLEWEKVALMATWMPESLTSFYNAATSDLIVSASGWTDFNGGDTKLEVEGGYGAFSATYGVAGKLTLKASEDVTITADAHYITAGFTPADPTGTNLNPTWAGGSNHHELGSISAFGDDEMGFGVKGEFNLSANENEGDSKWKMSLEYDWAQKISTSAITNSVEGVLTFVPADAAKNEKGLIDVVYNITSSSFKVYGGYLNYPLNLSNENNAAFFSAEAQYNTANSQIVAVGTLQYQWIDKGTIATIQGAYDTVTPAGVQPWSVMAKLGWDMAKNTNLTLSYTIGTFDKNPDDNTLWLGDITDNAGTLEAELKVSF